VRFAASAGKFAVKIDFVKRGAINLAEPDKGREARGDCSERKNHPITNPAQRMKRRQNLGPDDDWQSCPMLGLRFGNVFQKLRR
jgi:hypothetical protein